MQSIINLFGLIAKERRASEEQRAESEICELSMSMLQ